MRRALCAMLLLMITGPAWAGLEWAPGPELKLAGEPLDMVESADGQRLFVLTGEGKVVVLGRNGAQEAEIPLGFQADSITLSKDGNRLLLGDREGKRIRVLDLDERFTLPTAERPFRGPAEAAVTVVVFSDFQ